MNISKSKVLEIVRNVISPDQVGSSLISWNTRILKQGEQIMAGPNTFRMPFEGTIIFIDLAPRTNWAHPCLYVLVDNKTFSTKIVESSFPPDMGQPRDNYVVVLRFGKPPSDEHRFDVFGESSWLNWSEPVLGAA
jgi:hypothetical protein